MPSAAEPPPVQEDLPRVERDDYTRLLARLSESSVTRHFDAYADIAWDDPAFAVSAADPRWVLPEHDPLGGTAWYRNLPEEDRARLGLARVASMMKLGLEFERVLKKGLLEFTGALPNGAPEFRYAYHELIEEAQHSLMFQEFVDRSGYDAAGMPWPLRPGNALIVRLGRRFPPLFFLFVLGGEEPIDHVQRSTLRTVPDLHPLFERIMRIHVIEEARHVSFARHYLRRHAAAAGRFGRCALAVAAPVLLAITTRVILRPPARLLRDFGVPRDVVREAYSRDPAHHADRLDAIRRVRKLCADLGLLGPAVRPLWRAFGLLDA
ncbi:diiron oxygenase [Actinocorallia aurea]